MRNSLGKDDYFFKENQKTRFITRVKKNKYLILMVLPALIFYIVFSYLPMYGIVIAFKKFNAGMGIWGSPWNGFDNFKIIFRSPDFPVVLKNTLIISLGKILTGFWVPIVVAILLSELPFTRYKKRIQTIITFPHFLSWIVISGFIKNMFTSAGFFNALIKLAGGESVDFLANSGFFLTLVYSSAIWKEAGWASIIYIAVIAGANKEIYEAAEIDGANRFRRIIHVTLPALKTLIVMQLILKFGEILNAGYDQIFNLYNPVVYNVSDILDTYIFRIIFDGNTNQGIGAALGLFKSVVGFALLFTVDRVSKLLGERGLI